MKAIILIVMALMACRLPLAARGNADDKLLPQARGPYLGQVPPGPTPQVFAPGIVSTDDGWEAAISFAPDMSELFFTRRATVEGAENRVLHMRQVDGAWTGPVPAPFALDLIEYEAFVTPDNKKVIFKSQRPKPFGMAREGGIWVAQREEHGWSEARYVPGTINQGWIMSVTSTLDGTLYFTGNGKEGYGIYRSRPRNGEYAQPEFLPKEINKSKYFGASHPFIAPDESYLIFDANGAGGNSDLFISFRRADGGWTGADALPQPINSEGYEAIATVSPDGKFLFFNRSNDIYWVDAGFIGALRRESSEANQ